MMMTTVPCSAALLRKISGKYFSPIYEFVDGFVIFSLFVESSISYLFPLHRQ